MPDLSNLSKLTPNLLVRLLAGDKGVSAKVGLYRRVFVRLVDKAVYEYQEARSAIIAQIEEMQRPVKEMIKEGRFLFILNFTDHFENCINATARLLKLLDRVKSENESSSIPRLTRLSIEAHSKSIPDIRNAVEHMENMISKDEISEGQPIMLKIAETEDKAIIDKYQVEFNHLEIILRNLHKVAQDLLAL